jgi:cobalt-precorrin 5A hydrolase / precorrin-3B C17-methyltransferase
LLFQDFQPLGAIALTPNAVQCLQRLAPILTLWVPETIGAGRAEAGGPNLQTYAGSLSDHLSTLWSTQRGIVFCLATGAVVRLIAPLLQDKTTDPAIVVVDESGQFVISLCGGHQGGADQLARLIALQLGATPILTGASNGLGLPGIDLLGRPWGWQQGSGDWTGVSAAIARQLPVQVIQEAGSTLWQSHLPADHPFTFGFTEPAVPTSPSPAARIWISPIQRRFAPEADLPKVQWHPRVLWVGIGCERGTSTALIAHAVQQVLQQNHLAAAAIAGIATIDRKADEVGLIEFSHDRQLPLRCFPATVLSTIPVPNPSAIVAAEVGTPSVAEAAALLAATYSHSRYPAHYELSDLSLLPIDPSTHPLIDPSTHSPIHPSTPGVNAVAPYNTTTSPFTLHPSPFSPALRIPKQIIRHPDYPGAVTIAIAQAEQEYTGRLGQLWLIGTGPGQLDQITPAAQTAIAQADVVIGYALYIDLVRPLFRPGQIIEALPITQERQRADRAIELAHWGLTVAVISSGDCGIYGMAGLVLEALRSQGWDGYTPNVQVFPGITALQAAASRVGAPLMHDFCAISLSDLLTPWEVIETRLTAAAQADFVVALYNPKSQTRTTQIATARRIFQQYRNPQTPVALVKSAYRPDEQIHLTTLEQLDCDRIDMLTTVLIGNQSTRFHQNWMITPRGYLGFTLEENSIA